MRRRSMSKLAVAFVTLLSAVTSSVVSVAPVGAAGGVRAVPAERGVRRIRTYLPPVDGPIVDHFRPPGCPWCAGNRGIDYAVTPGSPVRAAAGGVVTFAGPVGDDLFVVVAHPDGLRTTYAFLASVGVAAGQRVGQGDAVGTAAGQVHFGVRRGDVYLDPESILTGITERVRLVPTDGAAPRRRLG